MPIYVFQCNRCDIRTELFVRSVSSSYSALCSACGSTDMARVYTPFMIYRSELTKLEQLDPRIKKRVDDAVANTPEADPMRHLAKMESFDKYADPGEKITF